MGVIGAAPFRTLRRRDEAIRCVKRPFIIYALPRSRTLWLSKFLTHNGWECKHDPLAEFLSLDKIAEWLRGAPKRGIIDTGLVAGWRQMRELVPEALQFTIRRDPAEVRASLEELKLAHLKAALAEGMRQAKNGEVVACSLQNIIDELNSNT